MLTIGNRQIERVLIIDDDPEARSSYEYAIEDMGLTAHQVRDIHNGSELSFLDKIQPSDVILCDYHLKKHAYASRNGDWVMRNGFQKGIPGVLCTSIHEAPIRRDYLRYIPGLLRESNPRPDQLSYAWEQCVEELRGNPRPSRRPWRTLVCVDNVDEERKRFYAVVPAWSTRVKVPIDFDSLPQNIRDLVEPDQRFYALVNTGAMDPDNLFFDEWEERP